MTTKYEILPQWYSNNRSTYYWDFFSQQAGIPMPETTETSSRGSIEDFANHVGGDLPGYRRIIALKKNATNPFYGTRAKSSMTQGEASWRMETQVTVVPTLPDPPYNILGRVEEVRETGQVVHVGLPTVLPNMGNVSDLAKAEFVSRARKRISAMSGGVFLGELRETLHMMRRPAQGIRDGLSRYLKDAKKRARGVKTPKRKNRVIAATWLEYTFGWSPLIADVYDGAKAVGRVVSSINDKPEKVRAESNGEDVSISEGSCGLANCTWSYEITTKGKVRANLSGAVNFEIARPHSVQSAFGLRPHDFFPTVWELIPYSFVVDYFSNIGDIISAASFCTAYLRWVTETDTRETTTYSSNFQRTDPPPLIDGYQTESKGGHAGSMTRSFKETHRYIPDSLVPGLSFNIPGIKQGFNIGALLAQARATRP